MVMQLNQFRDECLVAGLIGQPDHIAIHAIQSFKTIRLGLAVGSGNDGVV